MATGSTWRPTRILTAPTLQYKHYVYINMPPARTPTSTLPLKTEVLQILVALASGPRHGYAIMQQVEADSAGAVVPQAGAFYRTIRNMLIDELVEECDDPGESDRDARARYYYRLTRHGRAVARSEMSRLSQVVRLGQSRHLTGRLKQ
jgi:DNA-binding PadR family transcriptional regulator